MSLKEARDSYYLIEINNIRNKVINNIIIYQNIILFILLQMKYQIQDVF